MVDLYGIRELVDTPNVGVDLQFGMRIAELDQTFDAFIAEVDDPDAAGRLPIVGDDPSSLSSLSEADDPLVGPFLSVLSTGRFGRFRVEGQLTQAVLFGDWTATAVAPQIRGAFLDSLTTEETAILSSDETVAIPVTDIRIKLGYDILDNLTFGFGGYATTWFNVPSVPNARAGDIFQGAATLRNDEENLTFLGASFSLQYVFSGGNIMPSLPSWR